MAYTRYLTAIWIVVATERYADERLVLLADHFDRARLVAGEAMAGFRSALAKADRRSASALAEAIILFLVLHWSGVSAEVTVNLSGAGWAGRATQGQVVLSWSGEAARFLSTPLFLFLVLRWLWRFGVRAVLLHQISRLPLQLVPLHPGRAAGLGLLSIYRSIFSGFIFALSCVVASAMIEDIHVAHPGANRLPLDRHRPAGGHGVARHAGRVAESELRCDRRAPSLDRADA